MPSSLPDWDRSIAPLLRRIEELGYQVQSRALDLDDTVNLLRTRPDWTTRAKHELEQAIIVLEKHQQTVALALEQLSLAMRAYRAKPTDEEPSL